MEGAILSTANSSSFQSQLKNVTSALCARTLPKQRRVESVASSSRQHHTYPRTALPKRAEISCRLEPLSYDLQSTADTSSRPPVTYEVGDIMPTKPNGVIKLKGTLAREVASTWRRRVGATEAPAPADRVQSLFNDIELYPTKTQVFEMLVCARQCARRKSLTLTFGEFCVFAAELRRCSRQAKQTPSKSESPQWTPDKETICKHTNGSEASPPPCEVFLGGSCNPTTWRSEIAIPILKKMGITYFNPQVEDWSTELVEVEHRAKAAARALLFVLDSETRAVAASVEAAHLAAAPRDLLLVLRPYSRHQKIGRETISDQEYLELSRARATLQEAVERRGLPAFTDIPAALRCARAVLRGARTHPRHPLGHTILRLKRAYDAAAPAHPAAPAHTLSRRQAIDALRNVTQAPRDLLERALPTSLENVDFETFCAAVAEIADGGESASMEGVADAGAGARVNDLPAAAAATADANGLHSYNARLKAYGRKLRLDIPKNNGNVIREVDSAGSGGSAGSGAGAAGAAEGSGAGSAGDAVFSPDTERRLERLPAMLAHDVYLAGHFPSNGPRPEDILRREKLTFVAPRACDYTRMFSAPARRSATPHPESPRTDKKPRPDSLAEDKPRPHDDVRDSLPEDVQLRDRSAAFEANDRLSASDFYRVTEDVTPQPFKGTYDEELLLGARVMVFSASSERPCLATLVLAAHYMGLRPARAVLLVQTMRHRHELSEAAIKDYNRGRHYLTDLARRSGVPVFDSTEAALACAVHIARTRPHDETHLA